MYRYRLTPLRQDWTKIADNNVVIIIGSKLSLNTFIFWTSRVEGLRSMYRVIHWHKTELECTRKDLKPELQLLNISDLKQSNSKHTIEFR
jgi:hypothetical protein